MEGDAEHYIEFLKAAEMIRNNDEVTVFFFNQSSLKHHCFILLGIN